MKKTNSLSVIITSYLLILLLFCHALLQTTFAGSPNDIAKKHSKLNTAEKSLEPQQDVIDAATGNLLKRMKGSDKDVAEIIINIVRQTNGENEKIIGIGSHMLGNDTFQDPLSGGTSDFDYRYVHKGNRAQALARYKEIQKQIRREVLKKFGPDKGKLILSKINLYPPEQIIGSIDDPAEAIAALNRAEINPSLAVDEFGDPVTRALTVNDYDGLVGKGGKSFRDLYETTKGRVFWNSNGTVKSGFADIMEFSEIRGIYTIEGSANMSSQFKNFVENNLKEGDYRAALKNLKRTREMMKKGRDLSRLSKKNYLDDLIRQLDECCADDPIKLAEAFENSSVQQKLSNAFKQIDFDAAMLKEYAQRGDPRALSILREILEEGAERSGGKWAKTKQALMELGDEFRRLNSYIPWKNVVTGLMAVLIAYQVYDVSQKASIEDWEGAFREAAFGSTTEIAVIVGGVSLMLPVLVIQVLVVSYIEDIKASTYAGVASYQDCQNLIAGIYEVKGREAILENQRYETSIDNLAREYTEEEEVLKVVAKHAKLASRRGDIFDPSVEKAVYQKCSKDVVSRWSNKRGEIIGQAILYLKGFESEFNSSMFVGEAAPEEAWILPGKDASVDVRANFVGNTPAMQENLVKFAETLKSLGGNRKLISVDVNQYYRWIPLNLDEKVTSYYTAPFFSSDKASNTFTYKSGGKKNLRLEYKLEINVTALDDHVFSVVNAGYLEKTFGKTTSFNINVLEPKGTVEIITPSKLTVDSPVNLTAKTDNELQKLNPSFFWYDLTDNLPSGSGKSFSFTPKNEQPKTVLVEVFANINGKKVKVAQAQKDLNIGEKEDETTAQVEPSPSPSPKGEEDETTAQVKPSPSPSPETVITSQPVKLMFGGTAADIWEGHSDERGFRLKRKNAVSKGTGFCKWEAHVSSEVWGTFSPSFAPRTPEDLTKKIEEFATESKRWSKTATARSFSIGDYKGQFTETNIRFRGGGASPDAGYRSSSISAEGRSWILKDGKTIEIGYNISGGGCWENSDRAFLERQANAARNEATAIINGLTLTGGDFSKIAYTGPKLDGSDMPSVEIVIKPNRKKLKKGEIIEVRAVVKNAGAEAEPIEFVWTGDHGGKGANVQFIAEKPGKQSLSVAVNGAQYYVGSASVEFEIADLKVEIKQLTPETKVAVGVPVSFAAELLSEGKPASEKYIYRFQPSPEVEFDVNESAAKKTTAKFTKPGREKIWVVVLEQKGDSLETVAESEQIEIEVVEPELKITFDQEKPRVGKAVKAKVDVSPADLKNIDFRWEISSNAKQILESQDSKEVTFFPQDNKPVTVKVSARVPVSGEDLGEKTATITAQSFDVKVDVLGAIGVKPQIWKEGVGLVTVDKGIAVFQNVGLKAVVSPAAENLRYKWTLNEDSHFTGSSSSAEIRVNRSQTGMCTASVVVSDKNGIELGRATASFNVTISQDELNSSSKTAEAAEKLAEAKTISRKGEIDEAIKLAEEAAALNPKNTEAKTLADKLKRDKQTIDAQIEKTKQLMSESKFPEAQKELFVAKNINAYFKPTLELETELGKQWRKFDAGVQEGLGNIRVANEKKDFKTALTLAEQLRSEYQLTPGTQKELAGYERWANNNEAEKQQQRDILARGEAKFDRGDYAGAISDFDVMYQNFNNYWNVNIDPEPKRYGDLKIEAVRRQKRIAELVPGIKRTIEVDSKNEALLNQSLKDIEELIVYQPNNAEFQEYRSTISELLRNKINEAEINPLMERGDKAFQAKKYKDAIREYSKVIAIDQNNFEAYRRRAMANREQGNEREALRDFDTVIELDPDNHRAFLGRGILHRDMKNTKEAMRDFTRGIQLRPDYSNGYFYRGHLKLLQKDYQGAIDDLNMAIRLNPKNSAAYLNRGLAKSRLGDPNGALRDYNQAILINPKNSLAYNNRGAIKEQQNDLQGAKADYEKAVQLDPDNSYASNNLKKINAKISQAQTPAPNNVPETIASAFYPVDLSGVGGKRGTPRTAKNVLIDDGSWIRLKSTDERRLKLNVPVETAFVTSAIALVTNLDDATYLQQGRSIARVTIVKSNGNEIFEVKAGIHTSEWNYRSTNPKHKWVDEAYLGGDRFLTIFNLSNPDQIKEIRFDYIETGAEKWFGHSPGFVLRGITLLGSEKSDSTTTTTTGKEVELANINNIYGVRNRPTAPTTVTFRNPYMVTFVQTYHWNNGRGTTSPGTIGLRDSSGKMYGPWQTSGMPGQGGVRNAYWQARPNEVIPAGTYTIVDSEPATWAQNTQSGGKGFVTIKGYAVSGASTTNTTTPERMRISVTYVNASRQNIHIFATGENFSPANKLAPGERRTASGEGPKFTRITVYAGAGGKVVHRISFHVVPDGNYTVTFGSNNKLTVR